MGAKKMAPVSSERQRWDRTYNNLVYLLRTQQIHLETLLKERNLLERRIKTQHEWWASVVRAAEDQIFQMKCDMAIEDGVRSLQAAKSDLLAGSAQGETARLKLMLDYAENELAEDHKNYLDALHQKTSQSKDLSERDSTRSSKKKGFEAGEGVVIVDTHSDVLKSEIQLLGAENEKLSLKKTAEVSGLLLEKDFVCHQLKTLESDYADKLRRKADEVDKANEKITNLVARMEELQSTNSEKDKTIKALESEIAKMEADAGAQRNELSRVNKELETFRKSRDAAATLSLRPRSPESSRPPPRSKNNDKSRSGIQVKKEQFHPKESNHASRSEKGSRGIKRETTDVNTIPGTPKLFSSSFKAPKLKHPSPSIYRT
uniref:Uncharacterized protein n=2 Tax=Kalanchoe fedtschenkoi TaxID=63787 RepID=A0A7N1A4B6_KALFE